MSKKQMIVDTILATLLIAFVWQYVYLSRANYVQGENPDGRRSRKQQSGKFSENARRRKT